MNGFYVSLVFFGVLLVMFSLVYVFLDKKKVFCFMKDYADKKHELVEIIKDAEQMIEELNRFSDYIVNQMDLKNQEINVHLKLAEEKANNLSKRIIIARNETESIDRWYGTESGKSVIQTPAFSGRTLQLSAVEAAESVAVNANAINSANKAAPPSNKFDHGFTVSPERKNEKVVPIKNKYSEVIRLSQGGMQDLEIAKRLNMGKGEVELIIGLRK